MFGTDTNKVKNQQHSDLTWVLHTMGMLKLTELVFILILVPYSKGDHWTITVEKSFYVTRGSNLKIPCTFTYPPNEKVKEVFWKTNGKSECSKDDKDKTAFVFHPDSSCVLQKYQKTNLTGNKFSGDCSLEIANIQESGNIYVRVITSEDKYSFKKDRVVISVNGNTRSYIGAESSSYATTTLEIPESTTISLPSPPGNAYIYLAIFIPVLALLIIIILGIIAYTKRKRSHTLTRQASEYYVNFSRATTDPPKSNATCKTVEIKPTEKVIDEPIYANVQAPTDQMSQNMKHAENIYANMDGST